MASSRSVPVGSPVFGSRSIRPGFGLGVSLVIFATSRARVHPRRMAIGGGQEDGAISNHFVEKRLVRIGVGKDRKLPAGAANPRLLRILLGITPHGFEYLFDGRKLA